ncbi:FLJ37770-like protein [Acromyrmex echinatior]|uniref:FLJ37770-like protein n=1 Tax=Acromyrmex echinatior TaxID=103372 RepID=F4X4J3_ACREC|nr:FLJ37770-like protein [Acromyrmex echinatior]
MISVIEQRIVVKFHVKLGKTSTETYNLLKEVYGHECLSRARVFEWFKRFQDGREDVEDDSRPGRPSTSKTDDNIETIGNLIRSDRRLSIRAIGETVGIDKECVWQIVERQVMDSPPRQCAGSFRIVCQEVSSQVQHPSVRPSALFAGSCTVRLLSVS